MKSFVSIFHFVISILYIVLVTVGYNIFSELG